MIKKRNEHPKNYTLIVGCGRLGANLANTLSDSGENVLIIDSDKNSFKRLSPSYGGLTIVADGRDFDVLKEANIEKAAAVVAVTNKDNVNIMIAQFASHIMKTKKVIARLYDPERECVYRRFGIETICPAALSAIEIDKILGEYHAKEKELAK